MNAGVTEKAVLYSHFCFSWELSEIGAAKPDGARLLREDPAAFGRLCVETIIAGNASASCLPAAFGRLCVETSPRSISKGLHFPAAFGRLCVETYSKAGRNYIHLPAAFGRLCVETSQGSAIKEIDNQPPSGGCVLKPMRCKISVI